MSRQSNNPTVSLAALFVLLSILVPLHAPAEGPNSEDSESTNASSGEADTSQTAPTAAELVDCLDRKARERRRFDADDSIRPHERIITRRCQIDSSAARTLRDADAELPDTVDLSAEPLDAEAMRLLLESGLLDETRTLVLHAGSPSILPAEVVATFERLEALRRLDLFATPLEPDALETLGNLDLPKLRTLSLAYSEILPAFVRSAEDHLFGGLDRLDLRSAKIDESAAKALLSAEFDSLEILRLDGVYLKPESLLPLFRNESLETLRALHLYGELDAADVEQLDAAPFASNLRTLVLDNCDIGDPGARTLAEGEGFSNLTTLQLRGNRLTPAGVRALAGAEWFSDLRTLTLAHNELDAASVRAVVEALDGGELRELNLEETELEPNAAEELADSEHLEELRQLVLTRNRIADRGAEHLAESANLNSIRRLEVEDNGIGETGATALADATFADSLAVVRLRGNPIGDDGVAALAESDALSELRVLGLVDVGLTDTALEALAKESSLDDLCALDLRSNSEITATGWKTLAGSDRLEGLQWLDAPHTGDSPVRAVAEGTFIDDLRYLGLAGISMSLDDLRTLVEARPERLEVLDFSATGLFPTYRGPGFEDRPGSERAAEYFMQHIGAFPQLRAVALDWYVHIPGSADTYHSAHIWSEPGEKTSPEMVIDRPICSP